MATTDEVLKIPWVRASGMFDASRDFQLAWEILHVAQPSGDAKAHVPWPTRAPITCACMALELALKALITLDGPTPKQTHWAEVLFAQLSPESQQEIAALLVVNGQPSDVPALRQLVRGIDDGAPGAEKRVPPLEAWRYWYEYQTVKYDEGAIYALTRALHEVIVRRRPDFAPWPGVITR